MSGNEWITLAVLVGAMVMFVAEIFPVGVTGLCVLATLGLTGVLDTESAMHAFSNPAVVLVGSLYVVSASLIRTGVVDVLETRLLRASGPKSRTDGSASSRTAGTSTKAGRGLRKVRLQPGRWQGRTL